MRPTIVIMLLLVLLAASTPAPANPSYYKCWAGGSIVLTIYVTQEPKVGEELEIEYYIEVLGDVDIKYFTLKIESLTETLWTETIWKTKHLPKGYKHSNTITIPIEDVAALEFVAEFKYNDEYWEYTGVVILDLGIARSMTYSELYDKLLDLEINYSRLKSDYEYLQREHQDLLSEYEQLQASCEQYKNQYDYLLEAYQDLNSKYSTLQQMYAIIQAEYNTLKNENYDIQTQLENLQEQNQQLNTEKANLQTLLTIETITLIALAILYYKKKQQKTEQPPPKLRP